jgi:hypothetical protein
VANRRPCLKLTSNASTACPSIIKAIDVPCARRIRATCICPASVPSSIPGFAFLRFFFTPKCRQYTPVRKPRDLGLPECSSCVRICGYSYSARHDTFLLPHSYLNFVRLLLSIPILTHSVAQIGSHSPAY